MSRNFLFLLALAAFLMLGYFCVYRHAEEMQSDLLQRSAQALRDQGLQVDAQSMEQWRKTAAKPVEMSEAIHLVMNGREAGLNGTLADRTQIDRAIAAVEQTYGISSVTSHLQLAGKADPQLLERVRNLGFETMFAALDKLPDADLATFRALSDADLLAALRNTTDADFAANLDNLDKPVFIKLFPLSLQSLLERWKLHGGPGFPNDLKDLPDLNLTARLKQLAALELQHLKKLPDSDILASLRTLFDADILARLGSLFNRRLAAPDKSPGLSVQGDEAQKALNTALQGKNIEFETGSAKIRPVSFALLDNIIQILGRYPQSLIEIAGHTDAQGQPAANLELSATRALAVRDYLVTRGIAPERLTDKGYGDKRPLADNSTAAGRRINRRVEFKVLEVSGL